MSYRLRPWVSWGLAASFLLAVVSGLLASYPFHEAFPLISTVGIETVLPFGSFLRAFHFYTGQLTFLLLVWHLVEALLNHAERRRPLWRWSLLVSTFPLVTLALFTGYIVRGDQTGLAAGQIAEHLALRLPLIGFVLNRLLFAVAEEGVHRAFMAHIYLSVGVLVISGLWHFRLRAVRLEDLAVWATLAAAVSLVLPVSLEAPSFETLIKGPWFFLGIQELLRHLPPWLAGLVFPSIPVLSLVFFRLAPRGLALVLVLWTGTYVILTALGALR